MPVNLMITELSEWAVLGFLEVGASHRPGHRDFLETESINRARAG